MSCVSFPGTRAGEPLGGPVRAWYSTLVNQARSESDNWMATYLWLLLRQSVEPMYT